MGQGLGPNRAQTAWHDLPRTGQLEGENRSSVSPEQQPSLLVSARADSAPTSQYADPAPDGAARALDAGPALVLGDMRIGSGVLRRRASRSLRWAMGRDQTAACHDGARHRPFDQQRTRSCRRLVRPRRRVRSDPEAWQPRWQARLRPPGLPRPLVLAQHGRARPGAHCMASLAIAIATQSWASVPFLLLFCGGFTWVAIASLRELLWLGQGEAEVTTQAPSTHSSPSPQSMLS